MAAMQQKGRGSLGRSEQAKINEIKSPPQKTVSDLFATLRRIRQVGTDVTRWSRDPR
jgi:hypothetical protein